MRSIPIRPAAVPKAMSTTTRIRPLHRRPQTPRTVFVVTDSAAVLDEIVAALEVDGFLVTTSSDGRDAITRLRNLGTPALVIADLDLPDRTGWHLIVAMSQDPRLARVPVVTLSSTLRVDPHHQPVISKPIDLGALRDVVTLHSSQVR